MSYYDFRASLDLAATDPPFYALIMTAMRKADTDNLALLRAAWPDTYAELQARYWSRGESGPDGRLLRPAGLLPGEAWAPALDDDEGDGAAGMSWTSGEDAAMAEHLGVGTRRLARGPRRPQPGPALPTGGQEETMSTEVARYEPAAIAVSHERSIEELVAQANKIKQAMEQAMEVDQHYGIIPGARKPSLWKPGAEKLCLLFRLDPQYHSEPVAPDAGGGGHLTVKSVCTLWHIPTGQRFGSGEASCSTRESKYAYRQASRKCPECGKEAIIKGKAEYGGGWLCFKKREGCGAKFPDGAAEIEAQETGRIANDALADSYNTVLKMANKRALVASILNVTAASDVFTQDLEDFAREEAEEPPPSPARKAEPARRPKSSTAAAPVFTEGGPAERMTRAEIATAEIESTPLVEHLGVADDDGQDHSYGLRFPAAPPGVDEAHERTLLLARITAQADRPPRLDAKARADLWEAHVGGDPREAPIEKLADLYAVLKARV